jgi:hypothetical protein
MRAGENNHSLTTPGADNRAGIVRRLAHSPIPLLPLRARLTSFGYRSMDQFRQTRQGGNMTTVFARRIRTSLMLGMALVGLNACSRTIRIRDLLDRPQDYDGKTVQVAGTVTQSAGVLGTGAFQIDDGTGKIYVIARGQGVPREGAKTKAQGRFESVFSFLGRTMAAIVQSP